MMSDTRCCSDCGTQTEWGEVEQEYERDGIRVRLNGLPAMVCPNCGATSFTPETTEHILEAANAMFKVASGRHKGFLTGIASK